jgi:cell division protease FtsH
MKVVRMVDFEYAKDKVLMGAERRSMIISEAEKKITAIHEAGHAILTVILPHADPIHKVTIIPRGMALGLTQQLPVDEKHNYSRDYLNDRIAILLGGRIAEEIMLGQITTGAGNDLERSTEMARDGVRVGHERQAGSAHLRQEGRADLPGPRDRPALRLQRGHRDPHRPGGQAHRHRELPPGDRASCRPTGTRLERMADELLAREVLDGEQVRRIIADLPLDEPKPAGPSESVPPRRRRRPRPRPRAAPDDRAAAEQAAHAGVGREISGKRSCKLHADHACHAGVV